MSLGRPSISSIAVSDGETPHVASCHAHTAGPLQPPKSEAKSRTVLVIRNKQMQRRAVMHNSIVSCRVMALEACLGQSPGSLRLFLGSGYRGWQKRGQTAVQSIMQAFEIAYSLWGCSHGENELKGLHKMDGLSHLLSLHLFSHRHACSCNNSGTDRLRPRLLQPYPLKVYSGSSVCWCFWALERICPKLCWL